jgi:DNA-binding MarR family transcriptional regulator
LLDSVRSGLTISQVLVLLALDRAPARGAPMRILAEELGVSVPTTTGLVDRLVRESLVERRAHPQDRRIVLVRLTADGGEVIRHVLGFLGEVVEGVAAKADEGERASLVQAVERVAELSSRIQEEQRRLASVV